MITLKETNLENTKEILNIAESENIFVKCINDSNKTLFDIVKDFEGNKNLHLFLVYDDNNIVGIITSFPYREADTLSLGVMYILKEYRGKGYGNEMVKLFLTNAKSLGFKKVFTKTWSSNESSKKIFKNLGFCIIERKLRDRINGDDTIKYIKE